MAFVSSIRGTPEVLANLLDNRELAKRFLLGNVSESERAEIEDTFLARDDLYQELLIAEDDLIDAYVRGELPATERELFERRASPRGHERVQFAQTLFTAVSNQSGAAVVSASVSDRLVQWWRSVFGVLVNRRLAFSFTLAAAMLVIVVGGRWLLTNTPGTLRVPQQAQIQPTPLAPRETSAPIETAKQQPPTPGEENSNGTAAGETPKKTVPLIATFTLLPGLVRGEGAAGPLVLPAGATEVRLRLTLEGGAYKKYRATLATPEGSKIWSRDVRNSPSFRSAHLTLSIPADVLKGGDYVLDLSGANTPRGWESVSDYAFRIVKK